MTPRRWDEIDALAARAEGQGGYVRRNSDALFVGDVELTGLDALEFVIRLNQRAAARAESGRDAESYRQGREDVLREIRMRLEEM